MDNFNIELAKETAIKAIKGAGKIVKDGFDKEKKISFKGRGDIVTHVDIASEKFILDVIKENFSEHSVFSEESGHDDKKSEYTWVLDPIDGTMNFYHGFEPFCIGLCLMKNDDILIGAIYDPIKENLYFAENGKGATLNGKEFKVSKMGIENSLITSHLSSKKEKRDRIVAKLEKIYSTGAHIRMPGSGLSQIVYVANGSSEGYFNVEKTHPWDILPAALLVQEAGGKITDIHGEKITLKSTSVLATNGIIHDEMLAILKDK